MQVREAKDRVLIAGIAEADRQYFSSLQPLSRVNASASPSVVAYSSCIRSLEQAGQNVAMLDAVISASQTPDFNNPGLVSLLLSKLAIGVPGLEIRQLGNGSLYAIDLACNLINSNQSSIILVSACDLLSRFFGGVLSSQALKAEVEAAREICADGAASLLVIKESLLNRAKVSSAVYEVVVSKLGSYGAGALAFNCPLPSASQFPLRITKQDVLDFKHLPKVNLAEFKSQLDSRLTQFVDQFLRENNIGPTDLEVLITHAFYPGMEILIKQLLNLGTINVLDVFPQRGYLGSAGILAGLNQLNLKKNAMVLLLSVCPGPAFAAAVLRRI